MKLRSLLALLVLPACHPAAAPAKPTPALTGVVHADKPGHGRLVTAWLTPAEAASWRKHDVTGAMFRSLIERIQVGPEVDVATSPTYRIEAPAGSSALVIVDVNHDFWRTLFGDGPGFVGLSEVGGGNVAVKSSPPSTAPRPERCQGDRMQLLVVPAPEVAGSVGNPTDRRFCAYLPPSYATSPQKRYPIVLMFGGFMSDEMVRFGGKPNVRSVADGVAADSGREAILIGVDASSKTGSSYIEDSPITGKWDSFMAGPALAAIDKTFRTLGTRESRGLIGQSTGGFIAVSFGLRHSDEFGAIGATSPDGLVLDAWMWDAPNHVKPWLQSWTKFEAAVGGPGQMTSYAADWSPGKWPIDLDSGKPNANWQMWEAHSPGYWLDHPDFARRIEERFSGKILIAASTHDEFDLTAPAIAFSKKLTEKGIANELELTEPGHLDGGWPRTKRAIEFVISKSQPASSP